MVRKGSKSQKTIERLGRDTSPGLFMIVRSEAAQTGMNTRRIWRILAGATDGPAVLDSTSRSPKERNAVDMPGSAAAVEAS